MLLVYIVVLLYIVGNTFVQAPKYKVLYAKQHKITCNQPHPVVWHHNITMNKLKIKKQLPYAMSRNS